MEYTVIVNGKSYDLPKKTMDVAENLDAVMRVDASGLDIRQRYERLHAFVKGTLGEDTAAEILGSDQLEDIDLSDLTLVTRKIADAYDKPVQDYLAERNRRALNSLPIDKITSIANAAGKISNIPAGR